MIISEVIGGLGNQMFQYAAGWAIAKEKETSLKLDISGYSKYPLHQGFEIQKIFSAQVDIASQADMKAVLGWQSGAFFRKLLKRPYLTPLRKASMVVEPHFHFDNLRSKMDIDGYLSGYWQSEKYFSDYAADIRKQFQFKQPFSSENRKWVELIERKNAVAIHVRRGDFVNQSNIDVHGACSIEYYALGIAYMLERMADVEFFVFSDDVKWVKENLQIDAPCYHIENNKGADSFNDMRLMSLCRHNIIANSSFSWWGAWLNENGQQIAIAPQKWFASGMETRDLIPPSWVLL